MKKQTRGRAPAKSGPPPTPRQMEVYRLVLKFFAEHGYPPTFGDLVELGGKSSTSVVVAHLKSLHKRGLLVMERLAKPDATTRGRARGIDVPKLRDATKALATRLLAQAE